MPKGGGQKGGGGSKGSGGGSPKAATGGASTKGTPMTGEAAGRVQSAEARQGGGGVEKKGFASRAQAAAEKNK